MREEREEMSDEREGRGIHAVAPSCVLFHFLVSVLLESVLIMSTIP